MAGPDTAGLAAFRARWTLDTTTTRPRYTCVLAAKDTVALWRSALERLGASGGAAGDSAGAIGIATLAALDRAVATPERQPTIARGLLVRTTAGTVLAGCDPPLRVTGPGADSLASPAGRDVWLQGYCLDAGTLEWLGGHRVGEPRVDLFVMGLCPYARHLESSMCEDLARLGPAKTPTISVHYLLYWDDDGPVRRAGSTHGEPERTEDVVQILLRDEHPALFWKYIEMRSKSEAAWQILAQRAGLSWSQIAGIEQRVARDRDAILYAEQSGNTRDFPHVSGSPTVFWQGGAVRSITAVPGFKAPPHEDEKCSEDAAAPKAVGD